MRQTIKMGIYKQYKDSQGQEKDVRQRERDSKDRKVFLKTFKAMK